MGKIYEDENLSEEEKRAKEIIDTFGSITTSLNPRTDILHRDNIIDRIDGIMSKKEYRSVLLVGDKGCGKLSILEGYINKLSEKFSNIKVFTIDYDELINNVSSPEDFSNMVESIINIGSNNDSIIININNIGHVLNSRVYGNGGYSFLNKIVHSIRDYDMKVIATATSLEYDDIEDDFPYILDFFTIINVDELNKEETSEIIDNLIEEYEQTFNLNLPKNTSKLICENADKYIKDKVFPEKGIWLFDEVCSNIKLKKSSNKKFLKNLNLLNKCKLEMQESLKNNDYTRCEELNNQIESLTKKIERQKEVKDIVDVSELDILEIIGDIVNVNMSKLDKNQTSFLQKLSTELKKTVIGQDEAVDKITKNIIRNKLGLRKSAHSMGNFIFIGSTGVGKTHLAKQIAEQLYGSEDNLLRFDMSEYQSEIDVNKLLGSPPGYVGYKESGMLVKKLDKNPESVILFDEIEKAHPKIYDVLLQLLDEGFITGSDGNKVDATKSLIIFTSNIGVRNAKEYATPVGFSSDNSNDVKNKHKEEIIRKSLNKRFSPEFLNRLDGICYFNSLSRNVLEKILHKEMEGMNVNIKNICGKKIELSQDVEKWILDKVEKEENGARPIIRHLQQNIEEELSTMIVEDNDILKSNKKVLTAHVQDDKIVLK